MKLLVTMLGLLSIVGVFVFLMLGIISFARAELDDGENVIFIKKSGKYKKCAIYICLSFLCFALYLFSVGGSETLVWVLTLSFLVAVIFFSVMGVIRFVKKIVG